MAGRYIKLYDKILQWEWFGHPNTVCLFIYLLLKANYKDTKIAGKVIKRGQVVTSLPKISTDTGLSIQQTRTALLHLISTGEVTDSSNPKYRIITVVKYDEYQASTDRSTGYQQTTNRQVNRLSTDSSTSCIEYIEDKNNRIDRNNNTTSLSRSRFTKPSISEVYDYCLQRDNHVDPEKFYAYYESNGWKVGKNPMKDWKAAIRSWERNENTEKEYQERRARLLEDLPM